MSTLEQTQKENALKRGLLRWTQDHPERDFYPCEANISILTGALLLENLEPTVENFEKAFEKVGKSLAQKPLERESEPVKEKWPYPFPEIHTIRDIKAMDSKIYRDFWYDKKNGQLTEKAKTFRAVVQSIIDAENARRAL